MHLAKYRKVKMEIEKEEFKNIGYKLIDDLADFFTTIGDYPVTANSNQKQLQQQLGIGNLPEKGQEAAELITSTKELLLKHSLFNGHPKFLGYITSSPAPLGALADLLAAAVNPNVGAYALSPMASEIEQQTIQWLAEFIGVAPTYGGLLVSGGNMANFTAFLAARTQKCTPQVKQEGLANLNGRWMIYCSKTTHTWVEKAADLFGFGTNSIRWIETTASNQLNEEELVKAIDTDMASGFNPMMIIGTAGDVSTGAVDNLFNLAQIAQKYNLWFHVDGAYGAPAAILPELKHIFKGLELADSIALDPHKWLYSPLEAGCALVKNPQHLVDTYSAHPEYYNFATTDGEYAPNYYEYGLQNSRGFRALKVWLSLKHVGSEGYKTSIGEDVKLAKYLFQLAKEHPQLQAMSYNLSITTFRFIPEGNNEEFNLEYLNTLNEALLNNLQSGGEAFLSNALVDGKYCLRACVVNFRTSEKDMNEIVEIVNRLGTKIHKQVQLKGKQS